jgi:hypothetical protein
VHRNAEEQIFNRGESGAFTGFVGAKHNVKIGAVDRKLKRAIGERPRSKGRIFLLYLKAHNPGSEFRSTFLAEKVNNLELWSEACPWPSPAPSQPNQSATSDRSGTWYGP